ncbi:MAG: GTP-dependent dephospho-CoA kinase family protein [Halovenus sp.]
MTAVVELQASLRSALKETLGPLYTDTDALLANAGRPLCTVGDVVTYHVLTAGETPAVALVDERTEREAVDDEVAAGIDDDRFDRVVHVENPPAVLTESLLTALCEGFAAGSTLIRVDGEEDLATLPAVLAAPDGAGIVYGQPGEGMVLLTVDDDLRGEVRALVERMEGDPDRLFALLDA